MCGLIGAAGNLSMATGKFLANAFVAGTVRGHHSTGLVWANRKEEVWYYKEAVNGTEFISNKIVSQELDDPQNLFISGHNRWATMGEVNASNAHPFVCKHIALVHNGTLNELVAGAPAFGTDSEGIAWDMARRNPIDVVEDLSGAFALVWSDTENKTLNFARNSERELYVGFNNNNLMLWASEKGMLEWLAARNKITLTEVTKLPVGELWSFKISDMKEYKGLLTPAITKFTPKARTFSYGYSYGSSGTSEEFVGYVHEATVKEIKTVGGYRYTVNIKASSIDNTDKGVYKSTAYCSNKKEAEYIAANAYDIVGRIWDSGTDVVYGASISTAWDPTPIYENGKPSICKSLLNKSSNEDDELVDELVSAVDVASTSRGDLRLPWRG